MTDATAAISTEPAARPRRRRRWLLRGVVIVAAIGVTLVGLTQALLWSDYPRQIAEAQVRRILGVRASIGSVKIGWMGTTSIRDVSLTLPMESQPFVTIGSLDVRHTSLPLIAFSQELRSVDLSNVQLDARQDATGRWNLQQLIAPPSAPTPNAQPADVGSLLRQLPSVQAHDIRASITRRDGKRFDVHDIRASVQKTDPLSATFSADVPDSVAMSGRLALVSAASHDVAINITGVPTGLDAFLGVALPTPIRAQATWSGRRTAEGLAGTLQLDDVIVRDLSTVSNVDIRGRADITATAKGIDVLPSSFAIKLSDGKLADVQLDHGRVVYNDRLRLEQLRGLLNGGTFAVDGSIDLTTYAGQVKAEWADVRREGLSASGTITITTERAFNGRLHVMSVVGATVTLPGAVAAGSVSVDALADTLDSFDASLTVRPFTYTPSTGEPIVVPAALGKVVADGPLLQVASFELEDASRGTLSVYGAFDRRDQTWWTTIDTAALDLNVLRSRGLSAPLDLSLAATGSLTRADVHRLYVKSGPATAWAEGSLGLGGAVPVRLATWAWYDKPVTEDNAAQLNMLRLAGSVDGSLAPRDLAAEMDVDATELVFLDRRIGDLAMHVTGHAGQDDAHLRSRESQILGGRWTLDGAWSRRSGLPPTVVATFLGLPVENFGALVGQPELHGTIDEGVATLRLSSSRLDKVDLTLTASGSNLLRAPFEAESMKIDATLRDGIFHAVPVFHQAGGVLTADVRGDMNLRAPLVVNATLTDWPELRAAASTQPTTVATEPSTTPFAPRPRSSMELAGTLTRDVKGLVAAKIGLHGSIDRGVDRLASFALDATLDGTLLAVKSANLQTLDGALNMDGHVNVDDYNTATFTGQFERLTPATLEWANPLLGEMRGQFGGTLSIHPSVGSRPLGPLQVQLTARADNAGFRSVEMGDIDVSEFVDVGSIDNFRIVTDHAMLHVAGGIVEPFGRLTRNGELGFSQLITVKFADLDLDQITRAVDDDGKKLVGRLSGDIKIFGRATTLGAASGTADVQIAQSDLANFGPISSLYNILSVGTAGVQPSGEGNVSIRLEEGLLTIEDAHYFNRGVDARAYGRVHDLENFMAATPDVTLIGSLQPLRAIKLPFFGDVSDALAAAQSSITALSVGGSLQDPKVRQVSVTEAGSAVKKMLFGGGSSTK